MEIPCAKDGGRRLLALPLRDKASHVLEASGVKVADRNDSRSTGAQKARHIHREGDSSAANLSDMDVVAGRLGAKHTGWYYHWKCGNRASCRRVPQKASSRQIDVFHIDCIHG